LRPRFGPRPRFGLVPGPVVFARLEDCGILTIHSREAPEGWRFSKIQEQWLYDEVDQMDDLRGPFVHRIMLSTGITLEIPFVSVIIHRFTVPAVTKLAKQMA
jgi:hypothetical protein